MCGCQEQNRERDLGRSLGNGWTRRPKADNIQHVGLGCYRGVYEIEEHKPFQKYDDACIPPIHFVLGYERKKFAIQCSLKHKII